MGVLLGIGPALTVALLLPITFRLEPSSALIMFVRMWARLLTIPACGIYAGVLVFATLGAYAAGGTSIDLLVLCALGLLGLLMNIAGVPVMPAVVGLILGPLAEQQLRRALTLSKGDPSILVSSPITVFLWIVVLLALLIPLVLPVARRRRRALSSVEPGP